MPGDPVGHRPVLSTPVRLASATRAEPSARDWRSRLLMAPALGLFIAAAGLSLVGVLLIWSATRSDSGYSLALRQLVSLAIGMVGAWVVMRVDVRTIRALAPVIFVASCIGLVLVISPVGSTVNGSRSWIRLPGGFTLQPSELAKVALAVALAMIFAARADRGVAPRHRDVVLAWVVAGVPILLVMLQPDLGSAIVLVAMAVVVIACAGAPRLWTVAVVLAGVGGIVAAFTTNLLSGYQRNRLLAFLDPTLDPEGIGYQTRQVRIAIGSGGFWGQGLFEGRQTQSGFIPFQETDFIFSVAGEELGFAGAVGIVALIAFVVIRIALVSRHADSFGRLVVIAVAVWFGVQSFENIGMNLGLTPVTGLPLPFVSYGGSSMIAAWLALGLVGRIAKDRSYRRVTVRHPSSRKG